jgi:uncharacterized protein YjiS (DUF1127 family)
MSAPISKTELAFKLPDSLSYHSTWDDADYEPVLPAHRPSVLARLANGVRGRVASWRARHAAMAELAGMTDRELADVGLSRADIPRVTDADFIAERAAASTAHV